MTQSLFSSVVSVIGWTLLHLTWQAVAVYFASTVLRSAAGLQRPAIRYTIGCVALVVLAIALFATAFIQIGGSDTPLRASSQASNAAPTADTRADLPGQSGLIVDRHGRVRFPVTAELTTADRFAIAIEPWLSPLVLGWAVIVTLRLGRQVAFVGQIKRRVGAGSPLSSMESHRFALMARRMRIRQRVTILTTQEDDDLFTVGWLKPVILLPVALAASLSVQEIDALVAHELAHIRRFDFVINFLQVGFMNLLFFHPCVHWISEAIEEDRELCCDRQAARECGSDTFYATALVKVADLLAGVSTTPLTQSVKGGSLLQRVSALAGSAELSRPSVGSSVTMICSFLCLVLGGASAIERVHQVRVQQSLAETPEYKLVAELLNLRTVDPTFREAYIAALRATKAHADVVDPRFIALIDAACRGPDLELVWRDFAPLTTSTWYPTSAAEFPASWPYMDITVHRALVRKIWAFAKAKGPGESGRRAAVAALSVAAMRREYCCVSTMRPIVTDPEFTNMSGIDHATAMLLTRHWSAGSDAYGRAFALLEDMVRRGKGGGADNRARIKRDAAEIRMTKDRMPEIAFASNFVAINAAVTASTGDPVILDALIRPQEPR